MAFLVLLVLYPDMACLSAVLHHQDGTRPLVKVSPTVLLGRDRPAKDRLDKDILFPFRLSLANRCLSHPAGLVR